VPGAETKRTNVVNVKLRSGGPADGQAGFYRADLLWQVGVKELVGAP
jgi:hypothetical protein